MSIQEKVQGLRIQWKPRMITLMPICALLIATLYFLVNAESFLRSESEVKVNTVNVGEITRNVEYQQKIICEKNYLQAIKLYLATYGRINHSNLEVCFLDDEEMAHHQFV